MQFELTNRDPISHVKVIELIEDHPTQVIYGRNGVGKSMAVKLLQLVTGDNPYKDLTPSIWSNLKSQLGGLTIRATNLIGQESIEWTVDPARWPDSSVDPIRIVSSDSPAICSRVLVNGKDAKDEEIRKLLRVERLIGNETLTDSIQLEVSRLDNRIKADSTRLSTAIEAAYSRLHELSELLDAAGEEPVSSATEQNQVARKALDGLEDESGSLIERITRMRGMKVRVQEYKRLVGADGDPFERDNELKTELQHLKSEHAEALKQLDGLLGDFTPEKTAEIEEINEKLERHLEAKGNTTRQITELATEFGLGEIPGSVDDQVFGHESERREQAIERWRGRLAEIEDGPHVVELGESVLQALHEKKFEGLDDHIVATLSDNRLLSATELEAGIQARQKQINDLDGSTEANEITQEIEQAEEELKELESLRDLVKKRAWYDQRIKGYRRKLSKVKAGSGSANEEQVGSAQERVGSLEESIAETESKLSDLALKRQFVAGGRDETDIRQTLVDDLAELDSTLDSLEEDLTAAEHDLDDLAEQKSSARKEVELSALELDRAKTDRKGALIRLGREEYGSLTKTVVQEGDDGPYLNRPAAKRLIKAIDETTTKLREIETASVEVPGAIAAIQGRRSDAQESVLQVVGLIQESLGEKYFGPDAISAALFGGGSVVGFDLFRNEVAWKSDDGGVVRRHLDSFSSGEKAFAYTQARVASFAGSKKAAANSLLVLDEFGAFLERSRLENLEDYLKEKVAGTLVDQIVVILPETEDNPSSDYRSEAF